MFRKLDRLLLHLGLKALALLGLHLLEKLGYSTDRVFTLGTAFIRAQIVKVLLQDLLDLLRRLRRLFELLLWLAEVD